MGHPDTADRARSPLAEWPERPPGHRIEPTESGCRVTEWNDDLRPESVLELSQQISGVDDRTERNRRTMGLTLEQLAASLED